MRRSTFVRCLLWCLVVLGCDPEQQARFDIDAGDDVCFESGALCGEGRCDGEIGVTFVCDDALDCKQVETPCAAGQSCFEGVCDTSEEDMCACSTVGASVGPTASGCGFDDATECTGWQSVIIGSEDGEFSPEAETEALDRVVPDGSVFCAFDCCLQIECP